MFLFSETRWLSFSTWRHVYENSLLSGSWGLLWPVITHFIFGGSDWSLIREKCFCLLELGLLLNFSLTPSSLLDLKAGDVLFEASLAFFGPSSPSLALLNSFGEAWSYYCRGVTIVRLVRIFGPSMPSPVDLKYFIRSICKGCWTMLSVPPLMDETTEGWLESNIPVFCKSISG